MELSVYETAKLLKLSTAAIYKRIRSGTLQARRDKSGRYYVSIDSLSSQMFPRSRRRTITASPPLMEVMDAHLNRYGAISEVYEMGAWLVMGALGFVSPEQVVQSLPADIIRQVRDMLTRISP